MDAFFTGGRDSPGLFDFLKAFDGAALRCSIWTVSCRSVIVRRLTLWRETASGSVKFGRGGENLRAGHRNSFALRVKSASSVYFGETSRPHPDYMKPNPARNVTASGLDDSTRRGHVPAVPAIRKTDQMTVRRRFLIKIQYFEDIPSMPHNPVEHSSARTDEFGILRRKGKRHFVTPAHRGQHGALKVSRSDAQRAEDGDLVEYSRRPGKTGWARVTKRLGQPSVFRSLSEIAIRSHSLPESFSDETLEEAAAACRRRTEPGSDLRHLDFVTIDPEDARDRDDAVYACPDPHPANPGGHVIWSAIADVARFVQPGSALCREARLRGNSTYFPDMTVPMLPESLSGGACSLHEGADRPCLAVRIIVDGQGRKLSHKFTRALMRSRASLTYRRAQDILDGGKASDLKPVLSGLREAYLALARERARRQPLDIELQERKALFSPDGEITAIRAAERLECHRMIEEFMVSANVCAAETLRAQRIPHLCRVHEHPERQNVEELSRTAQACGLAFPEPDKVTTEKLNRLLSMAAGKDCSVFIGSAVLRTMKQAVYSAGAGSHFGLNLRRYAHFTSPIRRYADLVTHRALIRALNLGPGGAADDETGSLPSLARHLSECERRSAAAERESLDRFTAGFLAKRIDSEFSGTVMTVLRFGVFVRIDDTGAEGLVPASKIGTEYFEFDPDGPSLTGRRTGKKLRTGQRVAVRLTEADSAAGRLSFALSGTGSGR